MSRNLVCDACGTNAPETPEERNLWSLFRRHKLDSKTVFEKEWDTCPTCERAISGFIARLVPSRAVD